ncbi:hypothetical protein [Marinibacterium profundimaris]|uniref:hypothetical protein n=1 Tax=Marinibacterium profundimaris TaxID=1679460 RepID=UPI000B527136|nr:hypothetical protein [Marinibacterium profundimaris]
MATTNSETGPSGDSAVGTAQDDGAPGAAASGAVSAQPAAGDGGTAAAPTPGSAGTAAGTTVDTTTDTTATATMTEDPAPDAWAAPGETDSFAMYGLITLGFLLFIVIWIYAIFDRYAERRGGTTPLRTTIPTMLTIGLAYDLLPPLESFSILLPLSLIAAALARDIALWIKPESDEFPGGYRR